MSHVKEIIAVALGIVVVLAVVIPIIVIIPSGKGEVVVVKASEGSIVGEVVPEAGIFWGVPFSQPPTEEFRWRRPRDPVPYSDSYWNATFKRPGCIQICDQPAPEYTCPPTNNEDCLYLNIFVPKRLLQGTKAKEPINEQHYEINSDYLPGGSKNSLPVMIFFHGGNFLNGAGSVTLYDGRFMASKGDVIVVTTNYRMGPLGFLVQGQQGEESKGNFGLWDQVKAMQWVNKNIAMFGGNPNQVTLFGQSAGAESIGVHLTSHISGHLFQRGIMQSNPFGLPLRVMEDAKSLGDRFSDAAGCVPDDMECLRSRSIAELEFAFNNTRLLDDLNLVTLLFQPWSPVIDGDVIEEQPLESFVKNKIQQKPMLVGATANEATIYVAELFPRELNTTTYNALCRLVFKEDADAVSSMYPAECNDSTPGCDNRELLSQLGTDFLFECPQRRAINATTNQSWLYKFNQIWSFKEAWEEPQCYDKVCHGGELPYVFGSDKLTTFSFSNGEREVSDRIISYWTNFAHHGVPYDYRNTDLENWPVFEWGLDGKRYQVLEFKAAGDVVLLNPRDDFCNFWDDLNAYGKH